MRGKRLWHRAKGRGKLYEKYVRSERNREKDSINKPSAGLRRILPNTVHVFEDLDKEDLVSRKRGKNRRKRNARIPWKRIHRRISEVALTAYVDPSNTSRESLDAGVLWRPKRGRS
jgi:putative transposase